MIKSAANEYGRMKWFLPVVATYQFFGVVGVWMGKMSFSAILLTVHMLGGAGAWPLPFIPIYLHTSY